MRFQLGRRRNAYRNPARRQEENSGKVAPTLFTNSFCLLKSLILSDLNQTADSGRFFNGRGKCQNPILEGMRNPRRE